MIYEIEITKRQYINVQFEFMNMYKIFLNPADGSLTHFP